MAQLEVEMEETSLQARDRFHVHPPSEGATGWAWRAITVGLPDPVGAGSMRVLRMPLEGAALASLLSSLADGESVMLQKVGDDGQTLAVTLPRADHAAEWPRSSAAGVPTNATPWNKHSSVDALRRALCITAAEARVLTALMSGELPKQYAARTGLSVHTVRSHISSLLSKTGCRRQLDVVRMGLSLAARDA